MTDLREAAQMALDALEWCYDVIDWPANGKTPQDKAIKALRAALAQPEQEPVAWFYEGSDVELHSVALDVDLDDAQKANCTPLYTDPPQHEWQNLTDEEIAELWIDTEQ